MKLVAIVFAFILVACCSKQTCPTPARPLAPAPVVTVAPATPCVLPPRPGAFEVVGFPDEAGAKLYVTKSDLGQLQLWLTAMSAWATAAALCLESRP